MLDIGGHGVNASNPGEQPTSQNNKRPRSETRLEIPHKNDLKRKQNDT